MEIIIMFEEEMKNTGFTGKYLTGPIKQFSGFRFGFN